MFSFMKVLLFMVALGMCAFASQAFADTVFFDDFQSDTGGWASDPVIGVGDIGGSWSIIEGNEPRNVQVCDEYPDSGKKYVQLRDQGDPAQAWAVLESSDSAATLNQTVTVSTTIYKDTGAQSEGIALVDAAPSEAMDGQLFHINFQEDGSITYYDPADNGGTTYTFDGVDYAPHPGYWQNVTLTADMAAKTFTLAVDGHGSDTGSWVGDVHKIQGAAFFSGGEATGFVYIDNVQIDVVPEPGTIVLALAGAMGLLVCAWRKRK